MSSQHPQHHQQIGFPHHGKSEDSNTGKLIPVKHLKRGSSPPRRSDDSKRAKTNIKKAKKKQKQWGGGVSSSAARPHGTSEDSNTGKLIPVDRKSDDSIRGKKSKK